jgi:hypothetical protein
MNGLPVVEEELFDDEEEEENLSPGDGLKI